MLASSYQRCKSKRPAVRHSSGSCWKSLLHQGHAGRLQRRGRHHRWARRNLALERSCKRPDFKVLNSYHTRFTNLKIESGTSSPYTALYTAFEFSNSASNEDSNCAGSPYFSSKNSIDHVTVSSSNLNGLNYGVRFTAPYGAGSNASNDMTTISDTTFNGVTNAAVYVGHTQSHQTRLIAVNGYGAEGNVGCYVEADVGNVSTQGGFQGSWGKAVFCIDGSYGQFDFVDINSESSNRLLISGVATGYSTFPMSVSIQGGRFAANALNSDGKVTSYNRNGSFAVRSLRIDGTPPNGVAAIVAEPGGGTLGTSVFVQGVVFAHPGSDSSMTVKAPNAITLIANGNSCVTSGSSVQPCLAPTRY